MDEQTNKRTDKRKISPFYRTLSPIRAAALPPSMKTKEKVEQGKGTADHLMPLGYLFFFLGSGPDRGRSPVEWGDFPSVRTFVRPSIPPLWNLAGWLGLSPGWLGLWPGWLGLRPGWLVLRPAQRISEVD